MKGAIVNRKKFAGKTVLITGASSGIGEALSVELAKCGAHLILVARRKDRLEEISSQLKKSGAEVVIFEGDVTQDGTMEKAVAVGLARFSKIDVVIANAGFGVAGFIRKLKLEDYRRQFETNVFGVLRTIYASLDALRESRGQLVLIGSVAGEISLPQSSPYTMSKAAVHALARSIGPELRAEGIALTLIAPGFVESEIRKVDNRGALHQEAKDPIPTWIQMGRFDAAREILRAVGARKRCHYVTFHGKVLIFLRNHFSFLIHRIGDFGLRGRKEP